MGLLYDESRSLDTIRRSSFIFTGTVASAIGVSLYLVTLRRGVAVVRLRRSFRKGEETWSRSYDSPTSWISHG